MQIYKIIREKLGINRYKMSKLLGRSVQSYCNLEKNVKTVDIKELVKLQEIAPLAPHEFWALMGEIVNKPKRKK